MDYSKLSNEQLLELAKNKGVKFAGEVSKKIRPISNREGRVQDPNPAPIFDKEKQANKREELKQSTFDKTKVEMKPLDYDTAKKIIIENHYSHRMAVKQIALGFYYDGKLNTVIIYMVHQQQQE